MKTNTANTNNIRNKVTAKPKRSKPKVAPAKAVSRTPKNKEKKLASSERISILKLLLRKTKEINALYAKLRA